jgi:hypothetical protein
MKIRNLIPILIVAASLTGVSASATPTPTPTPMSNPAASPGPYCKTASWSPEEYRFYGDKGTIVAKLANVPVWLSDRRIFLQVAQGDSSAHIKLYEQQKDGTFTVTEWTTKQPSRLLADIDDAIVANKGVNCVGEQVKGVLGKQLKERKVSHAVVVPAYPPEAFADSIEQTQGDFIGFVLIPLC